MFALSLAELYDTQGLFDDVLRVTEDFAQNHDDATAHILIYRGNALMEIFAVEDSLLSDR